MRLEPSSEEATLRGEIRAWLDRALPEVWGSPERPVDIDEATEYAMRRRFDQVVYRDGWAGLSWAPEYGGAGRNLLSQIVFGEECEHAGAPEMFNRVAVGIIAHAIMLFGTEEQRLEHLPSILSSEQIWCQGFSEPDAGSDLASLRTRAEWDGTKWVFNGQKVWTTLAQYADRCFLLARTDTDKPRHRGISAFLVPMDQEGVEVRPIRQINGDHEFAEVFFNDATVGPEGLLGETQQGWAIAMAALEYERSTNFMKRQVRLAVEVEALLDRCREHVDVVPAALLGQLAELLVRSECLRFTVWRSVEEISRTGKPGILNNASKVYWSETHQRAALLAIAVDDAIAERTGELQGAADFRRSNQYLSSRAATIYAGTSEIQRNIIAERGLGLPR